MRQRLSRAAENEPTNAKEGATERVKEGGERAKRRCGVGVSYKNVSALEVADIGWTGM